MFTTLLYLTMSAASSCVSQVETLVLFITERPSTRNQYATPRLVEIHNIPVELQKLPQWVLWCGADKVNEQTGEVKLNKIPINPQTRRNASTTDPTTWGTFADCCNALETWSLANPERGGLGFVFTENDLYAGIDLDHCRDRETGAIEPWAQQLVKCINSYTEVSPSGTGVKLFLHGKLSSRGIHRENIEVYDRDRFFTVTGQHCPDSPTAIRDCQTFLDRLVIACRCINMALTTHRERFSLLFAGDWEKATRADGTPFPSASEADLALCNMFVTAGATTEADLLAAVQLSGLYDEKWERDDYQERTIGKALEATGSAAKAPQQTHTGVRVQVLSARELASKELPPVRWVVRGLVPEGLTMFAGDPKAGKSWAVLSMGLAVATGERAFGYFDTDRGDVLYFALEDSPQRLQGRVDTLLKGWMAPDNLRLVNRCPMMPEFEKTLEEMMQDYPETRLIVVDVLARVQRPKGGSRNAYLEDYAAVSPLQRFALNHGIGIVGVTHTNKRDVAIDKYHRVTGTTGIIGCADTILLLQRDRSEASGFLSVTGRDVGDAVFKAEFHNGVWVVQGEQTTPQPGPDPVARADAQVFLRSYLADGPRLATEVQAAARASGIAEATLRRAQKDLGIKPKKQGKEWHWSLPAVHSGGEWDKPLDGEAAFS